ncbi:MAG: hypothetical protein SGILL_010418, partial [Bacillariaceae sp.]
STVASQLKARQTNERKSLPAPTSLPTTSNAAKKTPIHVLPTKFAYRTTPPTGVNGSATMTKRSKTEPKPPRPSTKIPVHKNRLSTTGTAFQRRPSFKTPPPSSSNGLIGREVTLDTTTPPPPMSPMACSVIPADDSEEDKERDFLGANEEGEEHNLLDEREDIDNADIGGALPGVAARREQYQHESKIPPEEPDQRKGDSSQPHKNIDSDPAIEEVPTYAEQILGGSVGGSTSSRDSFVNFKRRRRRKKRDSSKSTSRSESDTSGDDEQYEVIVVDETTKLDYDNLKSVEPARRDLDVQEPQVGGAPLLMGTREFAIEIHEQSSISSNNYGTSIELDDDFDESKTKEVVARKQRNRRRASIFQPLPDPTESLSSSPVEKEIVDVSEAESTVESAEWDQNVKSSNIISCSSESDAVMASLMNQVPVKHEGKSILGTVQEDLTCSEGCEQRPQNQELLEEMQRQIDILLIEKTKLQKRVFTGLKDYEKRVTPFRNLFDDVSLIAMKCSCIYSSKGRADSLT